MSDGTWKAMCLVCGEVRMRAFRWCNTPSGSHVLGHQLFVNSGCEKTLNRTFSFQQNRNRNVEILQIWAALTLKQIVLQGQRQTTCTKHQRKKFRFMVNDLDLPQNVIVLLWPTIPPSSKFGEDSSLKIFRPTVQWDIKKIWGELNLHKCCFLSRKMNRITATFWPEQQHQDLIIRQEVTCTGVCVFVFVPCT